MPSSSRTSTRGRGKSAQKSHVGQVVADQLLGKRTMLAGEGKPPGRHVGPIVATERPGRQQAELLVAPRQRLVVDPLAQKVLAGEFKEGDTVFVDAANGEIQFWSEEFAARKADENKKAPVASRAN